MPRHVVVRRLNRQRLRRVLWKQNEGRCLGSTARKDTVPPPIDAASTFATGNRLALMRWMSTGPVPPPSVYPPTSRACSDSSRSSALRRSLPQAIAPQPMAVTVPTAATHSAHEPAGSTEQGGLPEWPGSSVVLLAARAASIRRGHRQPCLHPLRRRRCPRSRLPTKTRSGCRSDSGLPGMAFQGSAPPMRSLTALGCLSRPQNPDSQLSPSRRSGAVREGASPSPGRA